MKSFTVPAALVALLISSAYPLTSCAHDGRPEPERPGADLAIDWNERVLAIAEAEDNLLTLKGVRTAAMMHLAMHDALNAIRRRYAPYLGALPRQHRADPIAAAAQAAYEVAADQYPQRAAELGTELRRWLDVSEPGTPRDLGVALGKSAAAAILAARSGDRWNVDGTYEFRPAAPGVYGDFHEHSATPDGFVFGTGWANVVPFTFARSDQFRAPPPPALASRRYAEAFTEVKEAGRTQSAVRTPDQTHLAFWWKDFVESSHNRLARQLAASERLDLWRATRLLALLNASVLDGYVSSFNNKFFYNHWRPFTAIRWPGDDGNPATESDPQWNNTHGHTYPFPSYPSAHGTVCAAAMVVMADTFGDELAFTMSTPTVRKAGPFSEKIPMQPPTRTFARFSDAAEECAASRVYLGIHFRYDSVEGNRLGTRIGRHAVRKLLRRK